MADQEKMLPEFYHIIKVLDFGAEKHGSNNWLEENGKKSSLRAMHNSMAHHLLDSRAGVRQDHESGLDPLLHLALRALMCYTRIQRGLIHEDDV